MKKKAIPLVLAFVFCLLLPLPARANAAEPPQLSVVVLNPPQGLELSLVFSWEGQEEPVPAEATRLAWEGYYLFRPFNFPGFWEGSSSPQDMAVALLVETPEESFTLPLDTQFLNQDTGAYYNNLCVLDLQSRTLTAGQPWWRQPLLVVLRVALTLALEGLIFYLWGYQEKRSWIIFLVVNLVTQFGVNIAILCFLPAASRTYDAMWAKVLLYGPMEVLVILLEAIALPLLLKEQRKGTAVGCSVMANILSWFLGAVLLSLLPV